jgi:hypothetical protein
VNSLSHCEGERRGGEGRGGEGREERGGEGRGKAHKTCNIQYKIQNTEYTCSKTRVHKISNVPVFLNGVWTYSIILIGANPLLGPLEFGPPLPMALEMDFPPSKSLPTAPYKQQVH